MEYLSNADVYCSKFLDQTIRPFDFIEDASIPDGYPIPISRLSDFDDRNAFTLPSTANANINVGYVGFILSYGCNTIQQNTTFLSSTSATGTTGKAIYMPIWFILDSNGIFLSFTTLTASGQFWTYGTQNYNTVTGSTVNNGINTNTSLAVSLRMMASGIRVWPTIEVATNSSTLYVAQYYGCSLQMKNLWNVAQNGTTLINVIKESPDYNQFSNSQGMCARMDVQQEGIIDPVKFYQLDSLNNTNLVTDNLMFPCVVCQLSAVQTWTSGQTLALPINVRFQWHLEGILRKPTPIVSVLPPLSLDLDKCLQVMEYMKDEFPLVVEGHSFAKFAKTVGKVVQNPIVKSVANAVIQSNPLTKQIYDVSKNVINQSGLKKALQGDTGRLAQDMSKYVLDTAISQSPEDFQEAIRRVQQGARTYMSKNQKRKANKKMKKMAKQPQLPNNKNRANVRVNAINKNAGKGAGGIAYRLKQK